MKWSWQIIGAGLRSFAGPVATVLLLDAWSWKAGALILLVGGALFLVSWLNKIHWRDAAKAAREAAF